MRIRCTYPALWAGQTDAETIYEIIKCWITIPSREKLMSNVLKPPTVCNKLPTQYFSECHLWMTTVLYSSLLWFFRFFSCFRFLYVAWAQLLLEEIIIGHNEFLLKKFRHLSLDVLKKTKVLIMWVFLSMIFQPFTVKKTLYLTRNKNKSLPEVLNKNKLKFSVLGANMLDRFL